MSTIRRFARSCALAAGLFSLAPLCHAAPPGTRPNPPLPKNRERLKPTALAAGEYLPARALKAGMKGYGLTVFRGARIERFGVTVLGVLPKLNNGKDMILVRFDGGPLTGRAAYGVQGMSGSPIYVNGRIIGAYSAGFPFAREPLGLVTPIADMLEAWDPDLPQSPTPAISAMLPARPAEYALPAAVTIGGRRVTRLRIAPAGQTGRPVEEPGVATITPLSMPIAAAGVAPSRMGALGELLSPLGLQPMQGAGGGALPAGAKASPILPGGAIGVSLATGDLDLTAIGTLTYRRGNKIVAFGHPFTGIGPLDAPLYSAYILDIWPSYQFSFKLGAPVNLVGRVFQDRPFSIGGDLGARPVMVPVAIDIDDRSTKRTRRFRAEILKHPLLTPRIAAFAAANAIFEVHGEPGDSMATVSLEVDAEEVGTIRRTNTFFDPVAISDAAVGDLVSLLSTLASNPFYPVEVRRVKMNVRIEPRHDTAQIERIFLKQSRFEPGDTVEVGVVLKPYKRERIVETIPVRIPASAPSGALTLLVQGGGYAPISLAVGPGGGLTVSSAGGDAASSGGVRQLVRRFTERERNNDLVARLVLPTTAISVGGEKLTSLPPTVAEVMRSTRSTGLRVERDEVKVVEPTSYVLSGVQALSIRVAKKGAAPPDRPAPPAAGGESGGSTPPGGSQSVTFGVGGEDDESITLGEPVPAQTVITIEAEDEGGSEQPGATPGETPRPAPTPRAETTRPAGGEKPPTSASPAGDAPKPIGRLPGLWQQTTGADFRAGTLQGVTVTSRGDVRLAPTLARVSESTEAYFWSLAGDGAGGVFAGTGDSGLIYRIGADGKRAEWSRTGELEVHALARAADGTLYAGTSPRGKVLKIGADGKSTLFFQTQEKYVLALGLAPSGDLYAATGGGVGRVYHITPDGKGEVIYEGGESHVTALALGRNGTLYAGTAPGALVVKITGPGVVRPTVLYDAAESAISGLGVDAAGSVYAATTGRGIVYKIAPDAAARVLYDKASGAVSGLQVANDGTVWLASGATVYAIAPDETVQTYDAPSDIQILSLLMSPDGKLWASTGNVGAVYALGGGAGTPPQGTLVSSVLDARATARWGTLRWIGATPAGTQLLLETRSGDVAEPDATWSAWSRPYSHAPGEKIVSPPGRYLQYRATLIGSGDAAPSLRAVEAFYLTRNQAPTVAIAAPRGGEVWRGSKTLRWSGVDPDKDTLTYDVELSSDGGKEWKTVRGRIVRPAAAPATVTTTSETDTLARVRAELDKHPEISQAMREEILTSAPAAVRERIARSNRVAEERATPSATATTDGTRDTSLALDTTKWPDGTYLLRVVASDAAANPEEPMTGERVSAEFRIVNGDPTLLLFPKATTVLSDRSVRLEGSALHRLVAIRAVQYRVDNGDWIAAAATDGLFDSPLEPFTLVTAPLAPGAHTIEVQAQDEAGNTAAEKTSVQVR